MGCNFDCDQGRRCVCAPQFQAKRADRLLRWLIQFDIWVMRTFLGGQERETISAAAWNAHLTGKFFGFTYRFINLLFFFIERDHCRKAWEWQRQNA